MDTNVHKCYWCGTHSGLQNNSLLWLLWAFEQTQPWWWTARTDRSICSHPLSLPLSLSLRGHSDVQTKSVDTRQSRTQISFPSLRRTPLTYETSWGWFALLWDLLMRNDCCVSHGISSTWLLLNMNPFRIILDQISPMAPAVVNRYVPTLL